MDEFRANILRASYENIPFPVAHADTESGHDGKLHKAYLVPGGEWEPTGLNPDSGVLSVPLFPGVDGMEDLYPGTYRRLLAAIKDVPVGRLVHPTRGTMRVFMQKVGESTTAEAQNGTLLTLHWSQHTAAVEQTDPTRSPANTSATACTSAATAADAQIAADLPDLAATLAAQDMLLAAYVAEQFAQLDALAAVTFAAVDAAFAAMVTRVEVLKARPEVRTARGSVALRALASCGRTLVATKAIYAPLRAEARTFEVATNASITDVAAQVYGDARNVERLMRANRILRPTDIQAGRSLVILPDPQAPRGRPR